MVSTPVPYMNVALLSKHKCPQKTNDPFRYFWHVNEDKQEKDKATIMLLKREPSLGKGSKVLTAGTWVSQEVKYAFGDHS